MLAEVLCSRFTRPRAFRPFPCGTRTPRLDAHPEGLAARQLKLSTSPQPAKRLKHTGVGGRNMFAVSCQHALKDSHCRTLPKAYTSGASQSCSKLHTPTKEESHGALCQDTRVAQSAGSTDCTCNAVVCCFPLECCTLRGSSPGLSGPQCPFHRPCAKGRSPSNEKQMSGAWNQGFSNATSAWPEQHDGGKGKLRA